ncbi:MAG: CRISPR-associated endonuclease Cas2, partial [Aphanocapsa feldmannii 277cI]
MEPEQLWVIAYDTPSNRRRRKLAELLLGYGQRVQWSVFECRLRRSELQRLSSRLQRLIHEQEDSLRLWPIPDRSCAQVIRLGRSEPPPDWRD